MQELVEPIVSTPTSDHRAYQQQQRGTLQLLLARACFFGAGYVGAVILARELGASDYGIYGVVMSQLIWLEMMVSAGVPSAISKLMADGRHGSDEVERSARGLLVALSTVLFAICWFLAPYSAKFMRIPNGDVLLRIAVIDLPFAAIYSSYEGTFYGRRRFGVFAVAQAVYGLAKLAGIVALIGLGLSVQRVFIAYVLATFGISAGLILCYRPPGFLPRRRIMWQIAAIAAPMALYMVSGYVLLNLDLWSLKSLWEGEGEVVGQYVASSNLARILTVIPAAQAGVVFASVAWAVASLDIARGRRHIQEATRLVVVIGTAVCVFLSLDAPEVLSVLFSSAYADGQRFLRLQLAAFGCFALLDAFSHSLMAAGRQWFVATAIIATVPLAWLSNYLLIPRFGPMGAAVSILFGVVVGTVLTGAAAYQHFGSLIRLSTLVRVFVAAAVVGVISATFSVRGPSVLIKLALDGGLYLFLLWTMGEVSGKDFGLPGRHTGHQPA
jgi:O-antigen/teichoic acid export membrane protein